MMAFLPLRPLQKRNRPGRKKGGNFLDTELRGLLNHVIHLLSLEQTLGQGDFQWGVFLRRKRLLNPDQDEGRPQFDNAPVILPGRAVEDGYRVSGLEAQNLPDMSRLRPLNPEEASVHVRVRNIESGHDLLPLLLSPAPLETTEDSESLLFCSG